MTRGPRDLQNKQRLENVFIDELKKQIETLKNKLEEKENSTKGLFTPEQVDKEIRKVVNDVIEESKKKEDGSSLQLAALQKQIGNLEKALSTKSNNSDILESDTGKKILEMLEKNSQRIDEALQRDGTTEFIVDPDRPKVEQSFVDPIEKGSDNGLELFVQEDDSVKDISEEEEKEDIMDKVSALKNLLGKSKEE